MAAIPTPVAMIAVGQRQCGRGARPSVTCRSVPRLGMVCPRTASTIKTRTSGISSPAPAGNPGWTPLRYTESDSSAPIPSPAVMAHPSEWNRPTTAAASAGTMNNV